eukprot:TRINITY_DN13644_c1_g3_i1.p1 TRINITY_DN13644_c1_g3~~TRINITY_DN13644_c1_g3_i1.p1  ORF type:complete len:567 (-),score=94.42 TRINITY_DN13644_c1_g3_i1:119-1819(-)
MHARNRQADAASVWRSELTNFALVLSGASGKEDPSASEATKASAYEALARLEDIIGACKSVRGCALPWFIYSSLFSWRSPRYDEGKYRLRYGVMPPTERGEALHEVFKPRVREARGEALFAEVAAGSLRGLAAPRALRHPVGSAAIVVLAQGGAEYTDRPDVAPFLHQLRCYVERHGIQLVLDGRGERDTPLAFWEKLGDRTALTAFQEDAEPELAWNVRIALKGDAAAAVALASNEALVVVKGSSLRSKPAALERALRSGLDFAILLDLDVTVRPDAHGVNLVQEMLAQSRRQGSWSGHHIYVRDTSHHTMNECVNSGFIAVRDSEVSRLLLRLWREKLSWPNVAVGDQSVLAESILELLALERAGFGARGDYRAYYDHECLPYLFSAHDGVETWPHYCECWHIAAASLAGPYRHRTSSLVGFVNPERLDVNFVPKAMLIDGPRDACSAPEDREGGGAPNHGPFIMHWAGISQRKRCMEAYTRSFNASLDASGCPAPQPLPLVPSIGTRPVPDAPLRRPHCEAVLEGRSDKASVLTADELNHWWLGAYGCRRILGKRSPWPEANG